MRYLGPDGVARCLAALDPVAEVRRGLLAHAEGRTVLPAEYGLRWIAPAGGPARSLGLPAVVLDGDLAVGVKIINANPDNVRRGAPRASGLVLLFDPETAAVRTLVDGALVSAVRTAAVTALAVELLGRQPIERMLVVGAGVLAENHIDLLVPRLPCLRRLDVVDLDRSRAEALAERARRRHGPEVVVVGRPEEVSREAQLIVTVTTTTTPYLGLADVTAGATVVNVSLDDLDTDLLLGADRLVVDDWELVRTDEHRRLGRLARAGAVVGPDDPDDGRPRVDAELAAIVAGGRPGRVDAEEVIVVNPFGMAVSDIVLAQAIEHVAEAAGLFEPVGSA